MAGMKGFYLGLAGIAVVGSGALWVTNRNAASTVPVGPISMDAIATGRSFPGYAVGPEDAPVTLIEYADFQCPGCKMTWLLTTQDVKDYLIPEGNVRFIFRDFPLEIHPNSRAAHHAAACSDEQGKFWPMHDQLFLNQDTWAYGTGAPEKYFREYAESIGLDAEQYDACMAEGRYRGRIQASVDGGVELGVTSTPTMIIGNSIYSSMAYDDLKAIVDSLAASTS